MPRSKPFLGIALSGGTLKAAAHAGVLAALERIGVQPDAIAGTSAGSLVSALYAHGYRTEAFHKLLLAFPGFKLMDYGFPVWSSLWTLAKAQIGFKSPLPTVPAGLIQGKKFTMYIQRLLSGRRLQIPLYVVATDLLSGHPVVFSALQQRADTFATTSDLARAIAGSCALPGVFSPVPLDGYLLVDGAMRHYVPVSVLERIGCDKIIAVNLYRLPSRYEPRTFVDVLARSFDILLRESIDNDMAPSSRLFVVEPDMSRVRWRTFRQMSECVKLGEQAVYEQADQIRAFLQNE
ncbi:exported phospholipase [Alicyclobacillus hesperidum]|uniref:Exported phospholipase n=1 Tax=Alicyclobacillus hesperidum TaxID=89784 RepID=A0AA37X2P5_9BACL|nr:patatin-like phospholipase family protein [Alicyclobacillus hesperidum]GLV12620.1 exported phospholipase [Alicyclobacillus hesperidum]